MPLLTVISGGQIGADIAGLRAAKKAGLATGGFAPLNYLTKLGPNPELGSVYGLAELTTSSYPARTKANVLDSDGTIQFAYNWGSPGERATIREIQKAGKPSLQVAILLDQYTGYPVGMNPHPFVVVDWIKSNKISVLNVAGNANQQIEGYVEEYMKQVIEGVYNV